MTLNETWKNCLAMWKWIAEQIQDNPDLDVKDLKMEWLDNNGFGTTIVEDCFFCDYAPGNCLHCPGKLIDPSFHCEAEEYHYLESPVAFYEKIVALNKKRTK